MLCVARCNILSKNEQTPKRWPHPAFFREERTCVGYCRGSMKEHHQTAILVLLCFIVGAIAGRFSSLMSTVVVGVGINLLTQLVQQFHYPTLRERIRRVQILGGSGDQLALPLNVNRSESADSEAEVGRRPIRVRRGLTLFLAAVTLFGILIGRTTESGGQVVTTDSTTIDGTTTIDPPTSTVPSTTATVPGLEPPAVGTYTVTLGGSSAGSGSFERHGELRIRPRDDGPFDLCLKIGDPFAPSEPGAIWFGTIGTCFGSFGEQAMAEITESGASFEITPIVGAVSASGNNPNGFSFSTALTACWFEPDDGSMRVERAGTSLTGGINLRGLDACGTSASTVYTATYEATFLSPDPDAVISTPDPGTDEEPERPDGAARYVVSSVIGFELIEGDEAFALTTQERLKGAVFDIGDSEFVYAPSDSRTDLFPLSGTVTRSGDFLVLSASAETSVEPVARTTVGGTLDLSGAEPLLQLTSSTTTGSTVTFEATVIWTRR